MGVVAAKGEGARCARPQMDLMLGAPVVERASSAPKRRRRRDHNSHTLNYTYITSAEELDEQLPLLRDPRVGYVALDIETTGLKPWFSAVRTVQLAVEEPEPRQLVIDCFAVDPTPALQLLEDRQLAVITCNGSFEHSHLYWHYGIRLPGMWDLCYASREVHAGDDGPRIPHTYAALMERHVGLAISKVEQTGAWDAPQLTQSQLDYAAMDVAGALDIYRRLHGLVRSGELDGRLQQATAEAIESEDALLEARWNSGRLERQRLERALRVADPEQARRLVALARQAPLNFHDRAALAEMAA